MGGGLVVGGLVGKKRPTQRAQRTGVKGKVKLSGSPQAGAATTSVSKAASVHSASGKGSGTRGGSANASASFVSAADLWAEIARQANVDNEVNVGKLQSRIKHTTGHIARGRFVFDVAKLTAALGNVVCLPVALGTSETAAHNVVFCDKKGQAGHEHDGKAHKGLESWAKKFNDQGGINLLFASISDTANSSRRSQQYKQ